MNDTFFFVVSPYAALALLVSGTAVRYLAARRRPDLLRAQILEAKSVFSGRLFWLSLAGLMAAHGVGLALPRLVLGWNMSPARLYLSEGLAFLLGLASLAAGSHMVWKHLNRHGEGLFDEVCDTVFLALVFVAIFSGLLVAIEYRWGSSWGVMILTPYAVSLLRGSPALDFITEMPFLVQLHVFSTFAAVAAIPLTRLSSLTVALLETGAGLAARPISAIEERAGAWIQRHNPGAWFWPDED